MRLYARQDTLQCGLALCGHFRTLYPSEAAPASRKRLPWKSKVVTADLACDGVIMAIGQPLARPLLVLVVKEEGSGASAKCLINNDLEGEMGSISTRYQLETDLKAEKPRAGRYGARQLVGSDRIDMHPQP
jgi:hypothetical protein